VKLIQTQKKMYTACSHLYVESKKITLIEQRVEWWLPRAGVEGSREMLVKRYKLSVMEDELVLES